MKKTTVPPEIRRMLGPAPVLSTEDPDRFEEILEHFARRFRPRPDDALVWFRVGDLAVSRWRIQRLTSHENQVLEAARRKKVEEEEQARAKQAEEERKAREAAQHFAMEEARRPARSPDGLLLLGGPRLHEAKQRLVSALLKRPDLCRWVERQGITRDHFADDPKWQEAFDLVRTGADIVALVAQKPTGEIAHLLQFAEEMNASATFALTRQIMASVRAEEAAAKAAETALKFEDAVDSDGGDRPQSKVLDGEVIPPNAEPTLQTETDKGMTETANKAVASTELSTEFDYASVLPECLPLLVELNKLITAEQKRFDIIPSQIAFERECLALKLPDDVLDGEFKEVPVEQEAAQLPPAAPASAPAPSAIDPAVQPPSSGIVTATSSDMVAPAAPSPKSPCVEPPYAQDSSAAVDRPHGQLQSVDQTSASKHSPAEGPLPMLPTVRDSGAAENKIVEHILVVPAAVRNGSTGAAAE
jgi:hypothetical protein